MLTEGADPVRKVSIIPRGLALGVTFSAPESDRYNYREPEVYAKIKVALGGRAAEKVVFDDLSTGAESDIQNLTQVARGMVGRWGMSDTVGPIAVTDGHQDGVLLPGSMPASEPTQELVDEKSAASSSFTRVRAPPAEPEQAHSLVHARRHETLTRRRSTPLLASSGRRRKPLTPMRRRSRNGGLSLHCRTPFAATA
jgi:hypothetical protein